MGKIPPPNYSKQTRIKTPHFREEPSKIVFSFAILEKNEYFNLDSTCENWSNDLFDTMKNVSQITIEDIHSGKYSGKTSPLRIHRHDHATPPCKVPPSVSIEELWQIRISISKGGIHGLFVDNIFYLLWLDPQHNLYPDENHGGLKKLKPPMTCCKDRDKEIIDLKTELKKANEEASNWQKIAMETQNELVNIKTQYEKT